MEALTVEVQAKTRKRSSERLRMYLIKAGRDEADVMTWDRDKLIEEWALEIRKGGKEKRGRKERTEREGRKGGKEKRGRKERTEGEGRKGGKEKRGRKERTEGEGRKGGKEKRGRKERTEGGEGKRKEGTE